MFRISSLISFSGDAIFKQLKGPIFVHTFGSYLIAMKIDALLTVKEISELTVSTCLFTTGGVTVACCGTFAIIWTGNGSSRSESS